MYLLLHHCIAGAGRRLRHGLHRGCHSRVTHVVILAHVLHMACGLHVSLICRLRLTHGLLHWRVLHVWRLRHLPRPETSLSGRALGPDVLHGAQVNHLRFHLIHWSDGLIAILRHVWRWVRHPWVLVLLPLRPRLVGLGLSSLHGHVPLARLLHHGRRIRHVAHNSAITVGAILGKAVHLLGMRQVAAPHMMMLGIPSTAHLLHGLIVHALVVPAPLHPMRGAMARWVQLTLWWHSALMHLARVLPLQVGFGPARAFASFAPAACGGAAAPGYVRSAPLASGSVAPSLTTASLDPCGLQEGTAPDRLRRGRHN
eukprot:scaffold3851_cov387-Prasinococcus_capsulatus_cf.AAC.10